ncbi:hypothetical protein EDB81DRAFT_492554 [Dactylonectria macrodidyma]|uniref:Uncharacterized protein n=1 Tax=Dactylonectria macrodidyma TaxID=307937 RepID=A0A9P9EXM7_9HYPO|nr:hypothetical protein EDB81DRAFT_492554 [Dactylonectria macrodidyma]
MSQKGGQSCRLGHSARWWPLFRPVPMPSVSSPGRWRTPRVGQRSLGAEFGSHPIRPPAYCLRHPLSISLGFNSRPHRLVTADDGHMLSSASHSPTLSHTLFGGHFSDSRFFFSGLFIPTPIFGTYLPNPVFVWPATQHRRVLSPEAYQRWSLVFTHHVLHCIFFSQHGIGNTGMGSMGNTSWLITTPPTTGFGAHRSTRACFSMFWRHHGFIGLSLDTLGSFTLSFDHRSRFDLQIP